MCIAHLPRILLVLLQLLNFPNGEAPSALVCSMQVWIVCTSRAEDKLFIYAYGLHTVGMPSQHQKLWKVQNLRTRASALLGNGFLSRFLQKETLEICASTLQVMQKQHDVLDRNAVLVRACTQPLTESDQEGLQHHGIGSSLLGNTPPSWLVKWAALILQFIEVCPFILLQY